VSSARQSLMGETPKTALPCLCGSLKKTTLTKSASLNPSVLLSNVDLAIPTAGYAYAFVDLEFAFVDLEFAFVDLEFAFVDSEFAFVDSAFAFVDSEFAFVDSAFAFVDSAFAFVDSAFAFVDSAFAFVDLAFAFVDLAFAFVDSAMPTAGYAYTIFGVAESRYEFGCRDVKFYVSTRILTTKHNRFHTAISNTPLTNVRSTNANKFR
jgi:hypothetical protein